FSYLFFYCARALRDLQSFPTRRSSDLVPCCSVRETALHSASGCANWRRLKTWRRSAHSRHLTSSDMARTGSAPLESQTGIASRRSEEHTSELQSRGHLVCRLLLEKKKQ